MKTYPSTDIDPNIFPYLFDDIWADLSISDSISLVDKMKDCLVGKNKVVDDYLYTFEYAPHGIGVYYALRQGDTWYLTDTYADEMVDEIIHYLVDIMEPLEIMRFIDL